jgi:Flp pilus assembly protein TadG
LRFVGRIRAAREQEDRGAAVLEFALVAPVFILILVGIIEFGRAYNVSIAMQGAAREGARALALGRSATDVANITRNSTNVRIDGIAQTPCTQAGGQARVVVSHNFRFGIPFVPLGNRTIASSASMRCGL